MYSAKNMLCFFISCSSKVLIISTFNTLLFYYVANSIITSILYKIQEGCDLKIFSANKIMQSISFLWTTHWITFSVNKQYSRICIMFLVCSSKLIILFHSIPFFFFFYLLCSFPISLINFHRLHFKDAVPIQPLDATQSTFEKHVKDPDIVLAWKMCGAFL